MSELLTDPAPVVDGADTGVPDMSAQVPPPAVGEASGDPEGYVPKERFNGLMATYQRTEAELKSQLAEHQATISSLTEQLSNRPEPEAAPSMSDSQIEELQGQVAALTQMLVQQNLENTKASVLAEFPEAAPFADLIVANDPDDYRRMAQEIANRAKGIAPAAPPAEGEQQVTEPTSPVTEPPIVGGPPPESISSPAGAEDKVAEAIRNGDFQALLAAKREQQAMELVTS